MKKTYIKPKMISVTVNCENLLGNLSGKGISVGIRNEGANYEAESRGGSAWDDEE